MRTAIVRKLYREFLDRHLSLVVLDRGGKLHQARGSGLEPLLSYVGGDPSPVAGALVFDKIIGAAAALLLVYAEAAEVWTPVASLSGVSAMRKHRLPFRVEELIPFVPNTAGEGPCPLEELAAGKTPEELYAHLVARRHTHRGSR
jgi:hypothetical protein